MKPVVVVENVSKKFSRRVDAHKQYGIKSLLKELTGQSQDTVLRQDEFLAVDNISFALYPGDTFALIGRNGCGKTTTLKMLNGTLKPDSGKILIDGRVQALIALGAGFNPKLSGRENIFNAAAVLGSSGREISQIVDEVIDFSELEDFIDSPVQSYSSGMYARLGFAVAAHLLPDILLVDEILGVGDFAFQNKCNVKIQELKQGGVTIILVSHSHRRVMQLCDEAVWLHQGKLVQAGDSKEVVNAYLEFLDQQESKKLQNQKAKKINTISKKKKSPSERLFGPMIQDPTRIDHVEVSLLVNNNKTEAVELFDTVVIDCKFKLQQTTSELNTNLIFYREDGLRMAVISSLEGDIIKHIQNGWVHCRVTISRFNFKPDIYVLVIAILEGHSFLFREIGAKFTVKGDRYKGWGVVKLEYDYNVCQTKSQSDDLV